MITINQVLEILRNDPELDALLREGPIYTTHRPYFSRRKTPVDQCACAARAFWGSGNACKLRLLLESKYGVSTRYRDAVLIRISELREENDQNPKRL